VRALGPSDLGASISTSVRVAQWLEMNVQFIPASSRGSGPGCGAVSLCRTV